MSPLSASVRQHSVMSRVLLLSTLLAAIPTEIMAPPATEDARMNATSKTNDADQLLLSLKNIFNNINQGVLDGKFGNVKCDIVVEKKGKGEEAFIFNNITGKLYPGRSPSYSDKLKGDVGLKKYIEIHVLDYSGTESKKFTVSFYNKPIDTPLEKRDHKKENENSHFREENYPFKALNSVKGTSYSRNGENHPRRPSGNSNGSLTYKYLPANIEGREIDVQEYSQKEYASEINSNVTSKTDALTKNYVEELPAKNHTTEPLVYTVQSILSEIHTENHPTNLLETTTKSVNISIEDLVSSKVDFAITTSSFVGHSPYSQLYSDSTDPQTRISEISTIAPPEKSSVPYNSISSLFTKINTTLYESTKNPDSPLTLQGIGNVRPNVTNTKNEILQTSPTSFGGNETHDTENLPTTQLYSANDIQFSIENPSAQTLDLTPGSLTSNNPEFPVSFHSIVLPSKTTEYKYTTSPVSGSTEAFAEIFTNPTNVETMYVENTTFSQGQRSTINLNSSEAYENPIYISNMDNSITENPLVTLTSVETQNIPIHFTDSIPLIENITNLSINKTFSTVRTSITDFYNSPEETSGGTESTTPPLTQETPLTPVTESTEKMSFLNNSTTFHLIKFDMKNSSKYLNGTSLSYTRKNIQLVIDTTPYFDRDENVLTSMSPHQSKPSSMSEMPSELNTSKGEIYTKTTHVSTEHAMGNKTTEYYDYSKTSEYANIAESSSFSNFPNYYGNGIIYNKHFETESSSYSPELQSNVPPNSSEYQSGTTKVNSVETVTDNPTIHISTSYSQNSSPYSPLHELSSSSVSSSHIYPGQQITTEIYSLETEHFITNASQSALNQNTSSTPQEAISHSGHQSTITSYTNEFSSSVTQSLITNITPHSNLTENTPESLLLTRSSDFPIFENSNTSSLGTDSYSFAHHITKADPLMTTKIDLLDSDLQMNATHDSTNDANAKSSTAAEISSSERFPSSSLADEYFTKISSNDYPFDGNSLGTTPLNGLVSHSSSGRSTATSHELNSNSAKPQTVSTDSITNDWPTTNKPSTSNLEFYTSFNGTITYLISSDAVTSSEVANNRHSDSHQEQDSISESIQSTRATFAYVSMTNTVGDEQEMNTSQSTNHSFSFQPTSTEKSSVDTKGVNHPIGSSSNESLFYSTSNIVTKPNFEYVTRTDKIDSGKPSFLSNVTYEAISNQPLNGMNNLATLPFNVTTELAFSEESNITSSHSVVHPSTKSALIDLIRTDSTNDEKQTNTIKSSKSNYLTSGDPDQFTQIYSHGPSSSSFGNRFSTESGQDFHHHSAVDQEIRTTFEYVTTKFSTLTEQDLTGSEPFSSPTAATSTQNQTTNFPDTFPNITLATDNHTQISEVAGVGQADLAYTINHSTVSEAGTSSVEIRSTTPPVKPAHRVLNETRRPRVLNTNKKLPVSYKSSTINSINDFNPTTVSAFEPSTHQKILTSDVTNMEYSNANDNGYNNNMFDNENKYHEKQIHPVVVPTTLQHSSDSDFNNFTFVLPTTKRFVWFMPIKMSMKSSNTII